MTHLVNVSFTPYYRFFYYAKSLLLCSNRVIRMMPNTKCPWMLLFLFWIGCSHASEQETLIVGCQDIDYYPHYNFNLADDKGYAWAVLEAFSKQSGHQFEYRAYPIKRLQRELADGNIAFVYPDNAGWQSLHQKIDSHKLLSEPLITASSGTIVLEKREFNPIEKFGSLAVPHGFTPEHWLEVIAQKRLHLLEVDTPIAALNLVLKDRVDGADIESHVARHLLAQSGQQSKVRLAKSLPHGPVTFHLSTIKRRDVIEQLNAFIASNQALMTQLRAEYQL